MSSRALESAERPLALHWRKEGGVSIALGRTMLPHVDPSSSCGGQKKDNQFLRKYWSFEPPGLSRGGTLAADNYEWQFDYVLPGSTPESIEGLDDSWIVYRMKATIDRGILAQNIITRKHIRVVRTLDTAALELFHEMVLCTLFHVKLSPVNWRSVSTIPGMTRLTIH